MSYCIIVVYCVHRFILFFIKPIHKANCLHFNVILKWMVRPCLYDDYFSRYGIKDKSHSTGSLHWIVRVMG